MVAALGRNHLTSSPAAVICATPCWLMCRPATSAAKQSRSSSNSPMRILQGLDHMREGDAVLDDATGHGISPVEGFVICSEIMGP